MKQKLVELLEKSLQTAVDRGQLAPAAVPADSALTRPRPSLLVKASAIWLLPELCTHTNSTSFTSLS
mgnify:CR=1 FL=1